LRRMTLLPALLASLLLAVPAQAQVERKTVAKSAASIARYWTPKRMEAAKPADRLRATRSAPGAKKRKATYPYTSYEVTTPYTQAPTSTHGKVFFTLGGVDYVCSGTALLSGNKSVVWTAGHCVNEGPGAFATNWSFVPAYKDGSAPFGEFPARQLNTTSGWGNAGDFSYDFGAAVVASAGGRQLTDAVGGRGIAFNYNRSQQFDSYGYPAAPPFTGQRLWVCDAPLGTNDTSANPATMGIGCNMTGGSSGGGWIVGSSVYSVNSYGYSNQRDVMYGPYQGSVAQSLYNQAASE
jgi:hypothetical protein